MNLIDKTYFHGDIRLQTGNNIVSELLDDIMPQVQWGFLVHAMGYELYNEFLTNIQLTAPAAKWLALRDGGTFYMEDLAGNEFQAHFAGLANDTYPNMLAYFTYFHVVRALHQQATSAGVTHNEVEAGGLVHPGQKLAHAWNEGVKLYGHDYRNEFRFAYFDSWITRDVTYPSLYNFLYYQNKENGNGYYPNWRFTPLEYINSLGI